MEFKVGDKVVYPPHGVGEIESIETKEVAGTAVQFFNILITQTGLKIKVALNRVESVGMRKIVDLKTVKQVFEILKDRKVAVDKQTWNRRCRDYHQRIKTGSVIEIAKVIRDLSVLKGDKELSFSERNMLEEAQGRLVQEIAIAKASSPEKIRAELQSVCQIAV